MRSVFMKSFHKSRSEIPDIKFESKRPNRCAEIGSYNGGWRDYVKYLNRTTQHAALHIMI